MKKEINPGFNVQFIAIRIGFKFRFYSLVFKIDSRVDSESIRFLNAQSRYGRWEHFVPSAQESHLSFVSARPWSGMRGRDTVYLLNRVRATNDTQLDGLGY